MAFKKAVKTKSLLRMAVSGASGAGKTYTSLSIASNLGKKIALIDSEFGSARKYADKFEFDVNDISSNKHPMEYIKAIQEASNEGYDVLIIDSLSHAWEETRNVVDKVASAQRNPNTFTAWKEGTKVWELLKTEINKCKCHVIVTMRAKAEYIIDEVGGKKAPRKIGMAPEVRDGTEYEFDIVLDMNEKHYGNVSKTRCDLLDQWCGEKPGKEFSEILKKWLESGDPEQKPEVPEAEQREKFNEFLQNASVKLDGWDRIVDVVTAFGYDEISQVPSHKFREIANAVKELLQK